MSPKPGPMHLCPKCSRTMRPHCAKTKCHWMFCGICALTLDTKTGRQTRQSEKP